MSARPRSTLTVGVVEDHPITRQGLLAALAAAGFGAVAAAESVEALPGAPDVVLCDLSLPPGRVQGAAAVEALVGRGCQVIAFSALAGAAAQLGVLAAGARGFVPKASQVPALLDAVDRVAAGGLWVEPQLAGWLLQDVQDAGPGAAAGEAGRRAQVSVLAALAQGDRLEEHDRHRHWPPGTSAAVLAEAVAAFRARDGRRRPSPREWEVIDCIGRRGMGVRQSAEALGVSESTVRTHLQAVKEKYLRRDPQAGAALTPKTVATLWAAELP